MDKSPLSRNQGFVWFIHVALGMLILFAMSISQLAHAAATFTSVAVSPTSGSVPTGGTLHVTFSGTVKSTFNGDAVYKVEVMKGSTSLNLQSYPVTFNSVGDPNNTTRTITSTADLPVGTHTIFLRATTYTDNATTDSSSFVVTVSAQGNNSSYTSGSQTVPNPMEAGKSYSVTVPMKNTGGTTWLATGTNAHKLGSQNPQDNGTWGTGRLTLPSDVAPQITVNINGTVTAPRTAGTYNFQWRMVQEGVEWFGATTDNVAVNVVATKPTPSFTAPAGSTFTPTGGATNYTVSFSGTATSSVGFKVTKLELLQNSVAFATANNANGVTSVSGSKTFNFGSYDIELRATDERGIVNSTVKSITIATPPPTATISAPSDGSTYSMSSGINYPVTVSGSTSVTSPALLSSVTMVDQIVGGTSSEQSFTTPGTNVSQTFDLAPGTHDLSIKAYDSTTKSGQSATRRITIIAPTPTVTMSAPSAATNLITTTGSASLRVTGSASTPGGYLSKIEVVNSASGSDSVMDTLTLPGNGTTASYDKTLTLPVGNYTLRLRATNTFNATQSTANVSVSVIAGVNGNGARFITQTAPSGLRPGEPYDATVTMLNIGTTTWTDAAKYRLGSQNPQDNRTWLTTARAYLSSSIAPGQQVTITVPMTAPQQAGAYNFQWRMVQDDVGWFGDTTTNVAIPVAVGTGPTATLTVTPTNGQAQPGLGLMNMTFTGRGSSSTSQVDKIDLLWDAGHGFMNLTTINGPAPSLDLNYSFSRTAGVYRFKLRATDSTGKKTDSAPVTVNIASRALLGAVKGVRTNTNSKAELFGWTCEPGNAAALNFDVLLDAPTLASGGTVLTSGVANVGTEADSASVATTCSTPGAAHHFIVDLTSYVSLYAGRALYVVAKSGSTEVTLQCADNSCTMPGSIRLGLTSPQVNDVFPLPNPAFLRMVITSGSGSYDEVGFMVDGQWVPATLESPGTYSASTALPAGSHSAYAKVRQGTMTMQSVENAFTVASAASVAITAPSNGATLRNGTVTSLSATVSNATAASVKFYIDGALIGSATANGSTWTYNWTPNNISLGAHTITTKAFDSVPAQLGADATVPVTFSAVTSSDTPAPINVSVPQESNPDGGTLPGSLGVGGNGSATYSIPIQLPPGAGGMVPSVSLNYDSSNTTGSAGLGWSLGGLSNIDRCGKTTATDQVMDAVRFQNNYLGTPSGDRLCLDGQRLVLVSDVKPFDDGAYWASNAVYRTEVESFVRVSTVMNGGVRSFVVETKDGRKKYYGDTPDSYVDGVGRSDGLAHRWRISRSVDHAGNYISYAYSEDAQTGESKPTQISWGGNLTLGKLHYAKVVFGYAARIDTRASYIAGSPAFERQILKTITTSVDPTDDTSSSTWTTALTYTLTHELSPTSKRSLLKTIQACDATKCLPATTFNWGQPDSSAPRAFVALGAERVGPVYIRDQYGSVNIVNADFNGDGKTDLLERYRESANGNQQHLYEANADGSGWTVSTPFASIGGPLAVMETGDFDGDGKIDVLVADWPTGSSTFSNWRVCLGVNRSAGGDFDCSTQIKHDGLDGFPSEAFDPFDSPKPARLVKDFNGDGRDDIFLRSSKDYNKTDSQWGCLSNGVSGGALQFHCGASASVVKVVLGDRENNGTVAGSSFADIDGDGRVDHIDLGQCQYITPPNETKDRWVCNHAGSPAADGGVLVYNEPEATGPSAGGVWFKFANKQTFTIAPPRSGYLTSDVNADGYSDLIFGSGQLGQNGGLPTSFEGDICLSKGDGSADCKAIPATGMINGVDRNHLVLTVGDFDGDGIVDVLRPTNDTWNEDNVTGYQLCRLRNMTDWSGVDTVLQECEAWSGPLYYSLRGEYAFNDPALDVPTAARSMFYGDFDGDGKQDIATYLGGNRWQIHVAADQAKPGESLDKLVSVTNGFGFVERATYAKANDTGVYSPNAVQPDGGIIATGKLTYPTQKLVKTVSRSNGRGGMLDTNYKYYRQAQDKDGRGSLGFARIDSTDAQTGIVTSNWPYLVFPHIGANHFAQVRTAGGVLLSDTEEVRSELQLAFGSPVNTRLSYVSQATVTRKDLNGADLGTTVTTAGSPDSYGNLQSSAVLSKSSVNTAGWTASKSTAFNNDLTAWVIGEVASVAESRVNNTGTVTRTMGYGYDAQHLLKTETRQAGDLALQLVTTYNRDSFGNVAQTILSWRDPATNTDKNRTVFDITPTANGRFPRIVKNALGQTELRTFDARSGAPKTTTTVNGLTMSWETDGFGRKLRAVATDGAEMLTMLKQCSSGCPAGAATVAIQETKRGAAQVAVPVLVFSDNAGHALRSVTWGFDGTRIATDTIYDAQGRASSTYWPRFVKDDSEMLADLFSAASGAVLAKHLEYDELNRVKSVMTLDEAGASQTTYMDFNGFSTTLHNPKNQTKTDTRDVWGQLASSVDANGKLTQYEHDPFGNLSKTTDPSSNVVTVKYDALGRRYELNDPDLGKISYSVDPLGQVWRQINPKQAAAGKATIMQYDVLGRTISRVADDADPAKSHSAGWTYDKLAGQSDCASVKSCGQLVESFTLKTDGSKDFHREYSFDLVYGRPSTVTTYLDVTYTSKQEYDDWGRQVRVRHQRGSDPEKVFEQRYNGFGQLSRIERAGVALWTANSKDASQRLLTASLGNGLQVTRGYDPRTGRLMSGSVTNNQGGGLLQEGYTYDELGNVQQRTQSWLAQTFSEVFAYDGLNRLIQSTLGSDVQVFTYDDIGNIKTKTNVGQNGVYVYQAPGPNGGYRPHAVSSIPNVGSFSYDANGNMTSGAGRTVDWTPFDMPTKITQGAESSSFLYDADYERVVQTKADGTVIYYAGAMEVEKKGSAYTVKTYWPQQLGVEIDKSGATTLNYTHLDRLGSIVGITDSSGNLLEKMAFDSWGKRRNLTDAGTPNTIDGVTDNKGYTGHEMLDQLDLVHMNGRVYDPLVARFLSGDPIIQDPEHSQSYNRYSYVWNNPTNLTDPTGFSAEDSNARPRPNNSVIPCTQDTRKECDGKRGNNEPNRPPDGQVARNSSDKSNTPTNSAISAINVAKDGAVGVKNFVDGGFGEKTRQSIENGDYGDALVYTVAGALYGGLNVISLGDAGAITNTVRAAGAELVAGQGGRFAELVGTVGDDLTAHHMPQAALKFTSKADGGAVVLTTAEHAATRTYAFKGKVTKLEDAALSFRDVLAKDIRDLRSIVGDRYNEGVKDMLKYYKEHFPDLMKKKD